MMIVPRTIPWEPIAAMPDDRKDGRPMLVWTPSGAEVASWEADVWDNEGPGWVEQQERMRVEFVTHWADISPPE